MIDKKYVVYILKSGKDGKFYTGHTADLRRRVLEHNSGKVTSTRNRRPLTLMYTEYFKTKADAYARERHLKSLKGGPLKKQLISNRDTVL
jgi:putative endonuclease